MKRSTRRSRRHRNTQNNEKQDQPFFGKQAQKADPVSSNKPFFQPKSEGESNSSLKVGQPGDKYEVEADNVADAVVNNTGGVALQQKGKEIRRKGDSSKIEEDRMVQEKRQIQRMEGEEEESVQMQEEEKAMQMQEEEESVQMQEEEKAMQMQEEEESVQMQEEEEAMQMQEEEESVQMQEEEEAMQMQEEEESVQMQAEEEAMQMQEEEEPAVQTKPVNGNRQANPGISNQIRSLAGKGKPLSKQTRRQMESAFGVDFSKVRIHTYPEAVELNHKLGAQAFTYGHDIFFNAGKYKPESSQGKHLLAHELTHVVQQGGQGASKLQESAIIQRNGDEVCEEPQQEEATCEQLELPQDEANSIVERSIINTLDNFQNIPITVTGSRLVEDEEAGVSRMEPVTRTVSVTSQYFINTTTAQTHYQDERTAANFTGIRNAIARRGDRSIIISSANTALSSGRAVEVGKGTPHDIRLFVEEAIRQGVVRQFGISTSRMTNKQQLTDLSAANLRGLIQAWMLHTGVGVDCSGFVLQAAYNAREAMQQELEGRNQTLEEGGEHNRYQIPGDRGLRIRNAQSFTAGQEVSVPTDLRPGDAWVVSGGGHIRIVINARQINLEDGTQTIEFETAESSGGSTQANPGPTRRTWRTASLTALNPITRSDGPGAGINVTGTFHRIP